MKHLRRIRLQDLFLGEGRSGPMYTCESVSLIPFSLRICDPLKGEWMMSCLDICCLGQL